VSNYRVRQVLALGAMPDRQLRLLIALATWMTDDTNVVRVGVTTLITDSGNTRNTVRRARRELEAAKKVISASGGHGRGDLTWWHVPCLPDKGVNVSDPLVDSDKGVNPEPVRGSIQSKKGGQPKRADQQKPDQGLNRRANTSGSISGDDLIKTIIEEIKTATGATISTDWADRVKHTILDGREPSNAGAYIRHAIRAEPDPSTRFLPIRRPGYEPL
jgi:hypothetical protein